MLKGLCCKGACRGSTRTMVTVVRFFGLTRFIPSGLSVKLQAVCSPSVSAPAIVELRVPVREYWESKVARVNHSQAVGSKPAGMRVLFVLFFGGLVFSAADCRAQTALPKIGTCPSGFLSSGKYCVPIKDDTKPTMPRSGQCPTGYYSSGKYCVASRNNALPAVPKNGKCPSGYYSSGSYCVRQSR